MDSVSVTSDFRLFTRSLHKYCLINPLFSTNSTFFQLTNLKRARTSLITSSCRTPSNPNCSNHGFGVNPAWSSFPFWEIIKRLSISQSQKWLSGSRTYSDTEEVSGCYLQNGGLGIALLSVTTNAKLRISPFVATLAANPTFASGLFAWIIAQSMKVFLNFFVERKWDLRLLFASGGMPSSHSALCTALTTSVALCHGIADSLFPVCLGFSLIVMYDAIGVRRHAGMQAEVLNMIVADLFKGHPVSERKLKEFLGHSPSQVLAGAVLGIVVACFCCGACVVVT